MFPPNRTMPGAQGVGVAPPIQQQPIDPKAPPNWSYSGQPQTQPPVATPIAPPRPMQGGRNALVSALMRRQQRPMMGAYKPPASIPQARGPVFKPPGG